MPRFYTAEIALNTFSQVEFALFSSFWFMRLKAKFEIKRARIWAGFDIPMGISAQLLSRPSKISFATISTVDFDPDIALPSRCQRRAAFLPPP